MTATGTATVRIGCGSAFDGDRMDWTTELARSGEVSYLGFDCLAESTLPGAYLRRAEDPATGYATSLTTVVRELGDLLGNGVRMVGNFGASNTEAALRAAVDELRRQHQSGVKVGVVHGDDIRDRATKLDLDLPDWGCRISEVKEPVVAVNVYTGAGELMELLADGADLVMGGRVADSSIFVAPICHALGWRLDEDLDRVALATVAGHLLECGVLVSGGKLADPPRRPLPDPIRMGMPIAEVSEDSLVITKTRGSGGIVDERTVKSQLGYEVHDPSAYLTPDLTLDISQAEAEEIGPNRVRVRNVGGRPRPETLKALVGLDLGWKVISEMSLGGPGCVERARFAIELLEGRSAAFTADIPESRADLIGMNALFGDQVRGGYPVEVRVRFAARCPTREVADAYLHETKHLSFAIAGCTPPEQRITRFFGVTSAYVPRSEVNLERELVTV
jgi:hypothetical protein